MKLFSFCLSGGLNFSRSFGQICWIQDSPLTVFFLSTLNTSAHCLSASKVSAWKSTYILIEDSFYVMSFLLLLSKFSPYFCLLKVYMFGCVPLWVYSTWNQWIHVFHRIWEFMAIISSNNLLAPFLPESHLMCIFVYLIVSHKSLWVSSLFILFLSAPQT